jgi:hypothetical protein
VTNCENVVKGPAAGGPAPAGPAAGTKPKGGSLALVGAARIRALLGGKLAVGVPCPAACRVSLVGTDHASGVLRRR